jgi:hypothetical protein
VLIPTRLSKQLILKSRAGKAQIDTAYHLQKQAEQISPSAYELRGIGKSILMSAIIFKVYLSLLV